MPVVVVDPGVEGVGPVAGILIGETIGPFAKGGLDEAFGFAVGLRPVGAGELVPDSQLATGGCEVARMKDSAVVGQHAAHRDSERAEVGHRVAQELFSADSAFLPINVGKANASVVIDSDEQECSKRRRESGGSRDD